MVNYMDAMGHCSKCGSELWAGEAHNCKENELQPKPLTFREFQIANNERCIKGFNHDFDDWSLMEWCGAATFEYGEAGNKAKKLKRIHQNIKGNKPGETEDNLRLEIAKEIADGIIYGFLTLSAAGYDAEMLIRDVFNAKSDEIGSTIKV